MYLGCKATDLGFYLYFIYGFCFLQTHFCLPSVPSFLSSLPTCNSVSEGWEKALIYWDMVREWLLFPHIVLSMQWHTCVQVGLHLLQRDTDMKWKSVAVTRTEQHHPDTEEMQPYSCCILCISWLNIRCVMGACHSFPCGPPKRKGSIWCVNNIRWAIRRDLPKIFINIWALQACWSTSSVNFSWEKWNVKSIQAGRAPSTALRVCACRRRGWKSLL